MDKYINIVAFNIPWPANYGGVIDVYYKMLALHRCGVKIILHCFEYERPHSKELEALCEKVYYYKRRTGVLANVTLLPYNVFSRKDPELLNNLQKNDYPILFDGLHSCYYINHPQLKGRKKIFRECNIEHDYYNHLAKAESNMIKKSFFLIEAWRFKRYQPIIRYADLTIAVSMTDTDYLRKIFPDKKIEYMPCFHTNNEISVKTGSSGFVLYHGKLSVTENSLAALYLINNVFSKLPFPCIIAGMNPPEALLKAAALYPNITIEANPSNERMEYLTHEAHIHMLITFQDTGMKLKLLNSLFGGRFTIVNQKMITGSGLDPLCHIANTPEEMIATSLKLMKQSMTEEQIEKRKEYLFPTYSNQHQGERLYKLIYEHE